MKASIALITIVETIWDRYKLDLIAYCHQNICWKFIFLKIKEGKKYLQENLPSVFLFLEAPLVTVFKRWNACLVNIWEFLSWNIREFQMLSPRWIHKCLRTLEYYESWYLRIWRILQAKNTNLPRLNFLKGANWPTDILSEIPID